MDKEPETITITVLKEYHVKHKNRRICIALYTSKEKGPTFWITTKRLADFKTREISNFEVNLSLETFIILKDTMDWFINDKAVFDYFKEDITAMDKNIDLKVHINKDFEPDFVMPDKE